MKLLNYQHEIGSALRNGMISSFSFNSLPNVFFASDVPTPAQSGEGNRGVETEIRKQQPNGPATG